MPDDDGYPTDEELARIRAWPVGDPRGLLEFVRQCWWAPEWGWSELDGVYNLSTGGWSGNEELIAAMHANVNFFWVMCWRSSRAGGHYEFALPEARDRLMGIRRPPKPSPPSPPTTPSTEE